jgi:site-specific DNA-methyltransferase (adenine-specific)
MHTNTIQPNTPLPSGQILVGDALEQLRTLPSRSIDTVVTSPPYFRLRNYDNPDQIGLEDSIAEWVTHLLTVIAEIERILKPTGSVWLNLGDSYSRHQRHGAPKKSLLLGPERLLLALAERGWSTRNKVIWSKPNPMPASARDRLSATWEPLYLLTRSPEYFFDLDAIRIPPRTTRTTPPKTRRTGKYTAVDGKAPRWAGPLAGTNVGLDRMRARGMTSHPLGKNPGDLWTIPTAAYRGAHFATFPEALVERPIKATCPQRVCIACGAPWWPTNVARHLGKTAVAGALRKSCTCVGRDHQPGIVLDPFLGSGTVAATAERLHRRWIGIELNPDYADLARQRIQNAVDRRRAEGAV